MAIQAVKLYKAVVASSFFVCVLLSVYYVHVEFFRVDVVFYGALLDCGLAVILSTSALLILPWFSAFNPFEKLQLSIVWLLLGYAYAISVPTVIDRSLSFYMLEKIQQRGGGIHLERFEDIFTKEYAREDHLVAIRLTEQQASGTIEIDRGCVKLTERGQRIATFSHFFRKHLLSKHRLLMGDYTDVLTDPFRHSTDGSRDSCR